jgi:DNA-binding MarR family transcriptional regulator
MIGERHMLIDLQDTSDIDSKIIDELATCLQLLVEAHRRYQLHAATIAGIGPAEIDTLLAINGSPGVTLSALCPSVCLASSTALDVISQLETSGHIERSTDIDDRRGLYLTNRGSETAEILREAYRYVLSTTGASKALTSALPQLDRITSALNAAARRENPPEVC